MNDEAEGVAGVTLDAGRLKVAMGRHEDSYPAVDEHCCDFGCAKAIAAEYAALSPPEAAPDGLRATAKAVARSMDEWVASALLGSPDDRTAIRVWSSGLRAALVSAAPRSLDTPEAAPDGLRVLVNEQAEDEGLWFIAETAPEAYLQQELRRLHATVEAAPRSLDAAWAAELDRLREVAQAVLVELDIIRKRRDESSNSPPPYGLIVHIDTHNDLRAALDALSAKLRERPT